MRKYKFLLFFCLIFVISPCKLIADGNFDFRHFTKNDGLAFNSIRSLYQDEKGIMWIGTYNGLNTYDGLRLKAYTREDLGVSSAFIGPIISDGRGDVLIGTDDGVVIYRYHTTSFERPAVAQPSTQSATQPAAPLNSQPATDLHDRVFSMVKDSQGNVWIGTRNRGLFRWNVSSQLLEKVNVPSYNESSFYRLLLDKNNRLYAAIYCESIICMDLRNPQMPVKVIAPESDLAYFDKDDIEGIAQNALSDNILYIASKRHGLCQMNLSTKTVKQLYALPQETRPTNLFASENALWLSSTSGLLCLSLPSLVPTIYKNSSSDPFSISSNHVTVTYLTPHGCLWVGTEGKGLNVHELYQRNIKKYYRTTDGKSLEGALVRGFVEGPDGRVWIATQRDGLLCYKPQSARPNPAVHDTPQISTQAVHDTPPTAPPTAPQFATLTRVASVPNNILAIELDGSDLLLGYSDGIFRYNTLTGRGRKYSHFMNSGIEIDNRILAIKRTSSGDIYVGTSIGMMKYDRAKDDFQNLQEVFGSAVNDIEEDPQGYLWLATYSHGVLLYEPQTKQIIGEWCDKTNGAPIAENVLKICVDERGGVWAVSFNSAFAKFNRETSSFVRIDKDTDNALPTESFLAAVTDAEGSLWLPASEQLVIYSPQTRSVRTIDNVDYLLDFSTTPAACLRLRNGCLLFGSYNGFLEIEPQVVTAQKVPQIVLLDFEVDGKRALPTSEGPLFQNIDEATEIVFTNTPSATFGLALASPQVANHNRCDVYCRLAGFDSEPINVTMPMHVCWRDVPKGEYTLQIFTYDKDGREVLLHKNISVVVKFSLWQTTLGALIIAVAFVLLLLVVFVLIYRHQEAAYNRKIALANEEIAQANEIIEQLTQKEEIFIARLEEAIAENIADADFDVTRLEDAMCMSRSSLSRKIHALYKITPVTYLRNKRLEKAAEILSGGKYRVNEVCYQVGFSSPSYFIKCFKEYFRCSPTAYFRNNKN